MHYLDGKDSNCHDSILTISKYSGSLQSQYWEFRHTNTDEVAVALLIQKFCNIIIYPQSKFVCQLCDRKAVVTVSSSCSRRRHNDSGGAVIATIYGHEVMSAWDVDAVCRNSTHFMG